VAVFVIFGLIAGESKGAREYLNEVRTGSANRRWQAAFELSKALLAKKDPALSDRAFAADLVRTFEEAKTDDPRVRRYLALTLGRLGDRGAVGALIEAADVPKEGEAGADAETRIYAIWALGMIGDPAAVPVVIKLLGSEDAGLRKSAAHALGAFPGPEGQEALVRALEDATEDVRWNAAIALARQGDARGAHVLLQMLDRNHLATVEGLQPDQREEAMLEAVAAAAVLSDPELRGALEGLAQGDPDLKVREAARLALQTRAHAP
jgi:HEAT repeat protein